MIKIFHWIGSLPLILKKYWENRSQKNSEDFLILLKLLDVKDMLSIQVHPSKRAAEIEFAKENAEGIPLNSPHRNYKDDNHKPELMVALSDFWLLHGFKPREKLIQTLQTVPELNFVTSDI